jgi:predicted AlkP superfamily pyrophosphatase or phosphodiesterase
MDRGEHSPIDISMRLSARHLVALIGAIAIAAPLGAQDATPPRPPKLVVLITVDQLLPEYFTRYESRLTGGLGRMWRNGAVFLDAYQDHAVTETAPGHSTTLSGRHPASNGIISNSLGVFDSSAPLIGGAGPGASPHRFRGSTLVDWMRGRYPGARVLSVSRKDRGAILPVGTGRHPVYWYASDGRFTTSSYYADSLPGWVRDFNARRIPHSYAGRAWELLYPASTYPEPDSVPVENRGNAFTFPHHLPADTAQAVRLFAGTPWMDKMTLRFALAGVESLGLGVDETPDLLAVSLSTCDAVGHTWGPDSREIHDQVLRLDRYLGEFIDSLYRLRDSSTIVFALTADHGVAPYPELAAQRHPMPTLRADLRPAFQEAARLLVSKKVDTNAVTFDDGILYIDRAAVSRRGVDPDSLARLLQRSIARIPGVLRADDVRSLASADTSKDYLARRWLRMLPPGTNAALVVTLHPYVYWEGVTYATHGTPHHYDAHVPLIFYGPGFVREQFRQKVNVVDIGPTLAHVVGVEPTEKLDGRVLKEALGGASDGSR